MKFQLKITDDDDAVLGELSTRLRLSKSDIVRQALREFIERQTGRACYDFGAIKRGRPATTAQ